MSIFSKITGINWHILPSAKTVATDVESVVIHGVEESSPLADELISIGEQIIANPPTSPVSALTTTGHVIAILDPNFEAQANAKLKAFVDAFGAKFSIPQAEIDLAVTGLTAEADTEMESVGILHDASA